MVLSVLKGRCQHGRVHFWRYRWESTSLPFPACTGICSPWCVALPWSLKPAKVHQVLLKAHHSDTHFSVFLLYTEESLWLPLAHLGNPGEFSCLGVAWLATCEPRNCEYVTLHGRGVFMVPESKMWIPVGRPLFCLPQALQTLGS